MELNNVSFYVQKDGYELKAITYIKDVEDKSYDEMVLACYKAFEGTDAIIDESDQLDWELI